MLSEDASSDERSQPLVSIVIPTYNRAEYLREAVKSALAQAYAPLEVIVIDDASTDETQDVVQSLAAESSDDARLVYRRQEVNVGPNANWRAGIAAASGAFFCILADDDVLEPSFVERLVQPLIENEQCVFSFCDHWVTDCTGDRQPEVTDRASSGYGRVSLSRGPLSDFARTVLIDESAYIGAALFRRDRIGPEALAEQARSSMGGWLFYECFKAGGEAFYVPERLMNCRWVGGSVSRSQRWRVDIVQGNLYRYERMLEDPALSSLHAVIEKKWADEQAAYGRFLLAAGRRQHAREAVRQALRQHKSMQTLGIGALACLGPVGTQIAVALGNMKNGEA